MELPIISIELLKNSIKFSIIHNNFLKIPTNLIKSQENKHEDCCKFLENQFFSSEIADQASIFEPVFRSMPLELVALYARCQETLQNRTFALKAYEFIVSHDPQKFEEISYVFEQAADFFDGKCGDSHKALEILEAMLPENPRKRQEIWLKCGLLYKKIGDLKSAADAFKEILENNPKNAEARVLLSGIYVEEGDKSQALKVLERDSRENQREIVFFSEDEQGSPHFFQLYHEFP